MNNCNLERDTSRSTQSMNPKVSIVVATFRRDKSLNVALESLVKQSYDNIEIIVVDDNADILWNEKVKEIVEKYKEKQSDKVVYIMNEKNKGSAETRNIGINNSKGEYITFLDDDDVYLEDKVKNQVEHMIQNESDYSLTDLWLYNDNGMLIEKRDRDYLRYNSFKSLERYHLKYHMTGTDAMMFRKDYLISIEGFSKINVGDEFYLMHKAIKGNGKFSYLNTCDIRAYVHTEISGLSSGDSKINGENELYNYKKRYFNLLSYNDVRYIKMRHYAVLAFAELRRKRKLMFFKYAIMSFLNAPAQSIILFIKRRKK